MNWSRLCEIEQFEQDIKRFEKGGLDEETFKQSCRDNGIYGIRGSKDLHMVRVKLPLGILTPAMCEAFAMAVEKYTPNKLAHITTRQDIQFYFVKPKDIPEVLRILAKAGMTTREACGNTIRNVTVCPYAGISESEPFDVTPYALQMAHYCLRNPRMQNLPRKFKIAFEGCHEDHVYPLIHDLGIIAVTEYGSMRPGFRIYLGGGLGSHPRSAVLLEEFTPAENLIPTAEAVIRLFDRLGDRTTRTKARFKFVVERIGVDEIRKAVVREREVVLKEIFGKSNLPEVSFSEGPLNEEKLKRLPKNVSTDKMFALWKETNATVQKQKDWYAVQIRCPLGDLSPNQLRAIGAIADRFAGGIRTTIKQNILLRWVPEKALGTVYEELKQINLALSGAERLVDITRCPGTETCNLAITRSRGLAKALTDKIEKQFGAEDLHRKVSIKISGCPNACGHHSIADIGLCGSASQWQGRPIPCYQIFLGGKAGLGELKIGRFLAKLPAKKVPAAVTAILRLVLKEEIPGESFEAVLSRIGADKIKSVLEPFAHVSENDEGLDYDWDDEKPFQLKK